MGGFAPIIVVEALSPVCWIPFPRFDISRNLWTECGHSLIKQINYMVRTKALNCIYIYIQIYTDYTL